MKMANKRKVFESIIPGSTNDILMLRIVRRCKNSELLHTMSGGPALFFLLFFFLSVTLVAGAAVVCSFVSAGSCLLILNTTIVDFVLDA